MRIGFRSVIPGEIIRSLDLVWSVMFFRFVDCVVFDINFTDENHENDENDGCFTSSSSWQTVSTC